MQRSTKTAVATLDGVASRRAGATTRVLSPAARVRRSRARRGFSLIEMVVVLLIIGMLVGAVAYNVLGQGESAKVDVTKRNLMMVRGALETYLLNHSAIPPTLRTLVDAGSLADNKFQDEWRRDFQFGPQPSNPKRPFVLWSLGKDGQPGTEDDIDAWEITTATGGTGQPNAPR